MHNLTITPTAPGDVPVPDPGDARTAASVIQFAQPLADSIAYLQNVTLGANTITVSLPLNGAQAGTGGAWARQGSGTDFWSQTDVSSAAVYSYDLSPGEVPPGVTVTHVIAYLTGASTGSHSALPATMPKVTFTEFRYDNSTTPYTQNQSDTSGSTGAYDLLHIVDLAITRVIDPRRRYIIQIAGETGANSSANKLRIDGLEIAWSRP